MRILINEEGNLSLEQHEVFDQFSILDQSQTKSRKSLDAIATTAEDNHYWIDAEEVIKLSPLCGNEEWEAKFWKMLTAVEPYGYSDMERKKVKAHIEHG
ncbi:MAG: hypothetical protein KTR18_15425 [Acidiferrobacterales bacterium]|nr:hypothetical protein [Acidiferrobacterales bacterium]